MKRIAMVVLIGLLFCSSTMLAEARSGRTFYSYYETEINRIDDNTQELLIKITNTTHKPVNNVILLIYTRDTKGIMHEQGFLFLGQLKPNVRKNYSVRIDTPYKLERYDVTPRVLQNDDFQLEEGAVYPVNYFYKYIKIETEDIQHDRGLGYFQGSLTNISSIPIKRLHFYLGYLDDQDNQWNTETLQWGRLNPGETRPYRFGRVLPDYLSSAMLYLFPIEPGYGVAE